MSRWYTVSSGRWMRTTSPARSARYWATVTGPVVVVAEEEDGPTEWIIRTKQRECVGGLPKVAAFLGCGSTMMRVHGTTYQVPGTTWYSVRHHIVI